MACGGSGGECGSIGEHRWLVGGLVDTVGIGERSSGLYRECEGGIVVCGRVWGCGGNTAFDPLCPTLPPVGSHWGKNGINELKL